MDENLMHIKLAGKKLYAVDNIYKERYSYEDLTNHIRKFNTYESLNYIGKLSYNLFHEVTGEVFQIGSTPIDQGILSFLSLMLIRHSNDHRGRKIDEAGLEKAAWMYINLDDAIFKNEDGVSYLLRYGQTHWNYTRELFYALSRTYILYSELWSLQINANNIPIKNKILEITGLDLKALLLLAFAFSSQAKNGHVIKYNSKELALGQSVFTAHEQDAFCKFLSCEYSQIRKLCDQQDITAGYEKNIFNPLVKFPLIIPQKMPTDLKVKPYLVPTFQSLIARVTNGLYYDLADNFMKNGKANTFRTAFGYVFQDYIGVLLYKAMPIQDIIKEFKYGKGKDTPDWFVINKDGLVVIEAKQSATFLKSKTFGKKINLLEDLKNTIGKAAIQLAEFDKSVRTEECSSLSRFKDLSVHRLIVTYDSAYFLNSFIKDYSKEILNEKYTEISCDFDFQIISIDDFEILVTACNGNLFSFLKAKCSTEQHHVMDFREYLSKVVSQDFYRNAYLESVNEKFFDTVKLQ